MCTAIAFMNDKFFFGRTLDIETGFGQRIVSAPRSAPLDFSDGHVCKKHYALLGMGIIHKGFPLLFDGVNEKGLCAAALNFGDFAVYEKAAGRKNEIASFELLTRTLALCKNTEEVREALCNAVITDKAATKDLPPTPLHWIFADKKRSLTVEQTRNGLSIYENRAGVLTNAPDFPYHEKRLSELSSISPQNPSGEFFSLGYGALGLPGDYSSPSRFLRGAFIRRYAVCESAYDFFRAIDTLSIPRGAVLNAEGKAHYTVYTSCIEADSLTYMYHAYPSRNVVTAKLVEPSVSSTVVTYL